MKHPLPLFNYRHMKPTLLAILFSLFSITGYSQDETPDTKTTKRIDFFSLGIRSTQSAFGPSGYSGMGFGGQFRLRLNEKLSTEWFADYIKTDIGGLGHRETSHIGWSVMFYPFMPPPGGKGFKPYFLAGHCFDFAKINGYQHDGYAFISTKFETKRWTSAVQLGLGTSYQITDRFDVSFSAQYMSHLGNDLHAQEIDASNGVGEHLFNDSDSEQLAMEGHLLLTFSLNYILSFKKG